MHNLAQMLSSSPTIESHLLEDDGSIPNHPTLPILLYQQALTLPEQNEAAACETLLARNGWGGSWRNGIYAFHHFHSTAHEALIICRGTVQVLLGGEYGVRRTVQSGDVILLPAGGGHKNLGATSDLLVVGAYPSGQSWDLCRGLPKERPQVLENIARVPFPSTDPIYGNKGPMHRHWT